MPLVGNAYVLGIIKMILFLPTSALLCSAQVTCDFKL